MSEGLVALKELRENGAVSFSRATISFTYLAFTKRADIIEKELTEREQYKAIEKELGIDFITLIKALREGFVDGNGEYHHFSNLFIDNIEIFDSYEKVSFYLNDYGKTWALTKEELEK